METIVIVVAILLAIAFGGVVTLYLHPDRRALRERNAQLQKAEEEAKVLRGECAERNTEVVRLGERNVQLERTAEELVTLRAEFAEKSAEAARLKERCERLEPLQAKVEKLLVELKEREAENARLAEQLRQESEQRAAMRKETEQNFKELATAILDEKSKLFRESNEQRLGEILTPFKENLQNLQKKIDECYTNEVSDVKSLKMSLKELTELNATISREARELTDALRGNSKVQGDWGEMILRQILEKSGLEEGVNFTMQATTNTDGTKIVGEENNSLRPDVVFHLPEGKNIVIDSKVSLTAYVNYVNATTEEGRDQALAAHLASINGHVKELATKQYQRYVKDAADFVMMFVPNEGAYMAAMNGDTSLWERAYQQQVVIISPTHLISVLKLMYQLWTRDKQTKNAIKIADETGKLYDKLCGFVADLEAVGGSLEKARKSYDDAYSKLSTGRGNLLKKAEDIKALGLKTTKQLLLENE